MLNLPPDPVEPPNPFYNHIHNINSLNTISAAINKNTFTHTWEIFVYKSRWSGEKYYNKKIWIKSIHFGSLSLLMLSNPQLSTQLAPFSSTLFEQALKELHQLKQLFNTYTATKFEWKCTHSIDAKILSNALTALLILPISSQYTYVSDDKEMLKEHCLKKINASTCINVLNNLKQAIEKNPAFHYRRHATFDGLFGRIKQPTRTMQILQEALAKREEELTPKQQEHPRWCHP